MADGNVGASSGLAGLLSGGSKAADDAAAAKKKDGAIGQTDFLNMLVAQLKNQDPLDPMSNDKFAVDLSQFAQVEQLIGIKEQLAKGGSSSSGGDFTSLASYLGHEVKLNSETLAVKNKNAGLLKFDLDQDTDPVLIDITNAQTGEVLKTLDLKAQKAGPYTVSLEDIDLPNGDYGFKVHGTGADGKEVTPQAHVAGIVTGFVPGEEPKLIVGGKQYNPADVLEVSLPSGSGSAE